MGWLRRHRKETRPERAERPVVVPGQPIPEGFIPLVGTGYAINRETGERFDLETTDLDTALAMAGHPRP